MRTKELSPSYHLRLVFAIAVGVAAMFHIKSKGDNTVAAHRMLYV